MKAYLIVEVEVTDGVAYEEFRKQLGAVNAKYDAKFLVRAGRAEALSGDWKPERLVVIEFPSKAKALAWCRSPDFARLDNLQQRASRNKVVLVEGV